MKFMCRESLDLGRSNFDHPLGARFEEMDALVFFDNVLVPWERVFLLGDVEMCNAYAAATHSTAHTGQQVVNRTVVKTEFILGLTSLMAETLGSTQVPHVQERIGEIVVYLETLKACVRAAEADAKLNQWGVMCPAQGPLVAGRNLYASTIYARLAEIVQLLGSSSLMALPTEADFDTPIAPELERYLATDTAGAKNRVRLFHLAWDVACSAFGGRQVLYERFFGGDPVRNTMLLYQSYDKTHAMNRVQKFLEREG
jgi:4-hydroxyphenylacetate 3-monooxygenase